MTGRERQQFRELEQEVERLRKDLELVQQTIEDRTGRIGSRLDILEAHAKPLEKRPPFYIPPFPKKLIEAGYRPPGA